MEKIQEDNLDINQLINLLVYLRKSYYNEEFYKKLEKISNQQDPETLEQCKEIYEKIKHQIDKRINDATELEIPQTIKEKRLYMDGCFDLCHSGHFNAIRQAKQLTDFLVLGLITDESVMKNKGYGKLQGLLL